MPDNVKVEVRGLKELGRAFKQVDDQLPKALKAEFLTLVTGIVTDARSKVPEVSGKAAASIKPRASARGASIAFGGSMAEYMPWLNFGGKVGRNKKIVRPKVTPDRYIYTTISEHKSETMTAAENAVEKVARGAGFETREGI